MLRNVYFSFRRFTRSLLGFLTIYSPAVADIGFRSRHSLLTMQITQKTNTQTQAMSCHSGLYQHAQTRGLAVVVFRRTTRVICVSMGRLKMQDLDNAGPGKWTKSQGWKMQDLENDGPNRRAGKWRKMEDPEKRNHIAKPCYWVARRQDDAYISVYRNYIYTMSVILHVIHLELSEHMRYQQATKYMYVY